MAVLLISLIALATVFAATILGALCGAFSGWLVGLFFGDTLVFVLRQLGVEGVAPWQLGCFLGFVGGFFRSNSNVEVKK